MMATMPASFGVVVPAVGYWMLQIGTRIPSSTDVVGVGLSFVMAAVI